MKFVIASDLHGAAPAVHALMERIDQETPDRVLLLGDLLYHGPRNDLPEGYAPKEVLATLNGIAERIVAVRGNCDAEVDQMMLEFPCMGDYALVLADGMRLFCTHGHVFGSGLHNSVNNMPKLPKGSAFLFGHTHIKVNERDAHHSGVWLFNPGSVAIPKDGSHSFGIFDGKTFTHRILL